MYEGEREGKSGVFVGFKRREGERRMGFHSTIPEADSEVWGGLLCLGLVWFGLITSNALFMCTFLVRESEVFYFGLKMKVERTNLSPRFTLLDRCFTITSFLPSWE